MSTPVLHSAVRDDQTRLSNEIIKKRQDSYLKTKHVEQYPGTSTVPDCKCVFGGISTGICAYTRSLHEQLPEVSSACPTPTIVMPLTMCKGTIQEINFCG